MWLGMKKQCFWRLQDCAILLTNTFAPSEFQNTSVSVPGLEPATLGFKVLPLLPWAIWLLWRPFCWYTYPLEALVSKCSCIVPLCLSLTSDRTLIWASFRQIKVIQVFFSPEKNKQKKHTHTNDRALCPVEHLSFKSKWLTGAKKWNRTSEGGDQDSNPHLPHQSQQPNPLD